MTNLIVELGQRVTGHNLCPTQDGAIASHADAVREADSAIAFADQGADCVRSPLTAGGMAAYAGVMAVINGDNSAETINGTSGADLINAAGGDDAITPGSGKDTVDGGTGDDVIDVNSGDSSDGDHISNGGSRRHRHSRFYLQPMANYLADVRRHRLYWSRY